jgi:general secretion pathway protein M
MLDRREQLERRLVGQHRNMTEMLQLQAEAAELRQMLGRANSALQRRDANFTLYRFLDRLAGEAGVKEKISYMKPSSQTHKDGGTVTSTVEMKLQALTLDQLVAYLSKVEGGPNMVWVRRLAITKKDRQQKTIDAVLQVETTAAQQAG